MEIEERAVICRVCLEPCNKTFEPVDPVIKGRLAVLLLKPDLSVKDPAVCRNCAENLERCSLFKTTCLNTEDYISSFVNQNGSADLDLTQIFLSNSKEGISLCEDDTVCRLCMELVRSENSVDLSDDSETKNVALLKIILRQYFPELNMNVTRHPAICTSCYTSLRNYFGFMENCSDMEKSRKRRHEVEISICKRQTGANPVKAKEQLKGGEDNVTSSDSKKCKKDNLCSENQDVDIKNEEIQIKCEQDDLDSLVERPLDVHKPSEETFQKCDRCNFEAPGKESLRKHMALHWKCEIYGFGIKRGASGIRIFDCFTCHYKTRCRKQVIEHSLVHRDDKIHRCKTCGVKMKYKYYVNHKLMHKTEEGQDGMTPPYVLPSQPANFSRQSTDKTYYELCDFKANCKYDVKRHTAANQKSTAVTYHECNICTFKTKYKYSLKKHMEIHNGTVPVQQPRQYQCEVCLFKTNHRSSLRRHKLIHRTATEPQMYSCNFCDYKSNCKDYLNSHLVSHQNPSDITMYQCAHCDFRSKRKSSLKNHMSVHLKSSESKRLRCEVCSFKTKLEKYLKHHMLVHQDPSEATMYQCESCDFKTKHKYWLKTHMLVHQEGSETPMYQCKVCEFKTKHRYNLGRHMLVHRDDSQTTTDHCEDC